MIKFVMFCNAAAGQATQPGKSTKAVNLQGVPATPAYAQTPTAPATEAIPSPNAAAFALNGGNVNFAAQGLSKESFAEFEEGETYDLVITKRVKV